MGVEYDKFRLSEDPINTVRTYYLEKIKKERRVATPWWIGSDIIASPTLRLWTKGALNQEEQNNYKAQLLILFPEEICNSEYNRATLWLCVRHSIINTHFRDLFTAGGKVKINGQYCPAIIKRILKVAPTVKHILSLYDLQIDIKENNPDLFYAKDKYAFWAKQISTQYPQIKQLENWLLEV